MPYPYHILNADSAANSNSARLFELCNQNFAPLFAQGISTLHVMQDSVGLSPSLLIRNTTGGSASRVHIEPNGYPSGTKAKLGIMFDPLDTMLAAEDLAYRMMTLFTTDDADEIHNGRTIVSTKSEVNQFGVWPTLEIGFDDGGDDDVCLRMFKFDNALSSWRTPMKGAWREGMSVTSGDYVLANYKMYQADASGTTGSTRPSHASGSTSDGSISFTFIEDLTGKTWNVRTVVTADIAAQPQFGFPDVGLELQRDMLVRNDKAIVFEDNAGNDTWEIRSEFATDEMRIDNTGNGSGGYLRFDSSANFMQFNTLSVIHFNKSVSGATPSLADTTLATLTQVGATNVTGFTGNLGNSECLVRFGDANSTLVHSASLSLKSGSNETPASGDVKRFLGAAAGQNWVEV